MKTYTKKDYNSGEGMLTTVWGPGIWHFLHTISFNYPTNPSKKDKKNYKNFILNLKNVLPCKHCRINLKKNLKALPLTDKDMENRESFSKYIYNLHEHINKMLGKNSNLSYEDVRNRYEHFRSRCDNKKIEVIKEKEKGCTNSLYGAKSKCIIKIVPITYKCNTFQMNKKCIKTRLKTAKIIKNR
jgi:hypothetical protein